MCTTISAAKHQDSNNSLKIKFKALKELEKGTPHNDVVSPFGVPMKTHYTWKKKQNNSSNHMKVVLGPKEKNVKKNETLNKVLKKWLLVLPSENILISGALLQEKTFELGNEVNIEGFQGSKG